MFCEKCGANNPDNAQVCMSCGKPMPNYNFAPQGMNNQNFGQMPNGGNGQPVFGGQPQEVDPYEATAAYTGPMTNGAPGGMPGGMPGGAPGPMPSGMPGGMPYNPMPAYNPASENKGFDIKKIVSAVVVIAAIFLVGNFVINLFGGGAKKPIKNMVKFAETGKTEYFFDAFPKSLVKELDEDAYDEIEEGIEDEVIPIIEDIEDLKISYDIKDKEKLDKDDREDLAEMLEDFMKEMDSRTDVKVSKAYIYEIDWEIEGDYEGDDFDAEYADLDDLADELSDQDIIVAKVNGKWGIAGTEELLDMYKDR